MLGLIQRKFRELSRKCFVVLYNSLVRPHLEYANTVWAPRRICDIYSQTRLISHLWDCQNCVILTEVDINRRCHSSPCPSRTNIEITVKNQKYIDSVIPNLDATSFCLVAAGVHFLYNFYLNTMVKITFVFCLSDCQHWQ